MKDGTELTHYGVKGMKWGKRLFGKVKGVFGKPKSENINNPSTDGVVRDEFDTWFDGESKRSQAANDRLRKVNKATADAGHYRWADSITSNKWPEHKAGYKKGLKQANNTRKRYSTRLNGR